METAVSTCLVLCLFLGTRKEAALTAGDHARSLAVDGRQRSYLVHVPESADKSRAWPVVLAFHGGGSNATQMVRFCGLNDQADKSGFVVVYPDGTGRTEQLHTWNAGNCCAYAMTQKIDDVKFTRMLLDDLAKVLLVDQRRVYATGMSNGAMFCYHLASELSDRIAAIAPVSGPMGTRDCHPKRPVSVLHFHGTDDQFAPFAGGRGESSLSGTDFLSVDYSLNRWIKANGCSEKPRVEELPVEVDDGTRATRKTWGEGQEGAEAVLIRIQGAGHTWPGRTPLLRRLGKSTRNVDANSLMWEFFSRHPLPE